MNRAFARARSVSRLSAVLAALALTACGNFSLDNPPSSGSPFRRIYVNDSAAADSLTSALVLSGIKLVLQPNKSYQFSVATARTDDQLKIFYLDGGEYLSLTPTAVASHETFPLISTGSSAQFFVAQLVPSDGLSAIPSLGHVSLVSHTEIAADTLQLRLLFIGKLKNLPDTASKGSYARKLFAAMAPIYSPFGIVLKGTYEIVAANSDTLIFPFNNDFFPLPGNRITNHAHLYLVERIVVTDASASPKGEILGFAPREVLDLDHDQESRVVLANQRNVDQLAVTAAHELGHFFGLRHTVSTEHDILQDLDASNVEDGFEDTKFCDFHISKQLNKKSALPDWIKPGRPAYCLRIAANECNAGLCDLTNLMHPVDCPGVVQTKLSAQQADFLKKNLATYRH